MPVPIDVGNVKVLRAAHHLYAVRISSRREFLGEQPVHHVRPLTRAVAVINGDAVAVIGNSQVQLPVLVQVDKLNAAAAILLGDDEIAKGVATVRDMTTGAQEQVSLEQLASRLAAFGR